MQFKQHGRRLAFAPVLVALAFAAFAVSALAGSVVSTSSITGTDAVFTNPPVGSSLSACGTATPGTSPRSGTFHYEAYTFRNISHAPQCVTVSLAVSTGFATATAYLGSFNPGSPGTNFLGGLGLSSGGYINSPGTADGFSFDVSCFFCLPDAPETFVVVVSEGFANNDSTYTLLVEGTGVIMTGGGPTAAASVRAFRASSGAKSVTVRWRTQSERNALAFNLYRGDGTKRVRLTRSGIPAAGDAGGHTYSYVDHHPVKGKAGDYWLQVVPQKGPRVMFGPASSGH